MELWILDEKQELAFEWNMSKTINVYRFHPTILPPEYGTVGIPVDCHETMENVELEDFIEFVEEYDND